MIDPRPFAVGSIRSTFEKYAHLTSLLPAMSYSTMQMHELEETINRIPCDVVLVATPIDLGHLVKLNKPSLRVTYEIEEKTQSGLKQMIAEFTKHRAEVEV